MLRLHPWCQVFIDFFNRRTWRYFRTQPLYEKNFELFSQNFLLRFLLHFKKVTKIFVVLTYHEKISEFSIVSIKKFLLYLPLRERRSSYTYWMIIFVLNNFLKFSHLTESVLLRNVWMNQDFPIWKDGVALKNSPNRVRTGCGWICIFEAAQQIQACWNCIHDKKTQDHVYLKGYLDESDSKFAMFWNDPLTLRIWNSTLIRYTQKITLNTM